MSGPRPVPLQWACGDTWQGWASMRLGEIVATMTEVKKRKLIGRLAGKEVARQGTVEDAAKAARMSSSELYQVLNAD